MGELKQHQQSMSIDEQVDNLRLLGLIISDEDYAKRILVLCQEKEQIKMRDFVC